MMKMILVFAILFTCVYFGIEIFREFTYKEKWQTAKVIGHALMIAAITTILLIGLVILF